MINKVLTGYATNSVGRCQEMSPGAVDTSTPKVVDFRCSKMGQQISGEV